MRIHRILAVALAIVLPALAAHAQHRLPTHHVREAVVNGQAPLVGLLPANQRIGLAVMLPLRSQTALDYLLQDLYDPQSPSYRQYLSVKDFTDQFGPAQEDYDAVVHFLAAKGMTVTATSPNRLVIEVMASAGAINKTFHVTMGTYRHPTENRTFYAPDREPTVDLDVPLWHIAGLDNYSIPRPLYVKSAPKLGPRTEKTSNTTGSGPGGDFLGSDRRAAYYGGTALTGSGQAVGLVEFDGYNLSDVNSYFTNVGQTRSVTINNVLLDGASAGSDGDDTEQVIDIIEAISMAPALSQLRVYIAPLSTVFSGGDTIIFNQMASENIAKQLSGSWNWSPADPTADEPIFKEFAAQGQTFVTASGDYGAYDADVAYFYPEEDWYVTAVGGTDLTTNGAGGTWESEIAWGGANTACEPGTGSGGGLSQDGGAIPSYQQIPGVINSSNKGSTTLRNDPDVAAEGNCDNYYCANGSCGEGLGGTSLAAPTWAGFIALVNQNNVAKGEATEGFLNPAIYLRGVGASYHNYFHDVTVGDNFNGDSPSLYSAVTGYDLVTGWGSPLSTGWLSGLGIINTVAGDGTSGYSGDGGAATSAELALASESADIAVDSAGNIYIADYLNERLRKVTAATGIITTVAGTGTAGYSGDGGPAASAELHWPAGAATDSANNVYIGDYGNSRVRKITVSTGIITTVAGNGTYGYSGDGGPATSAELAGDVGVATDSSGNIYIADLFNNRIRKVTVSTGIITTVAGNGTAGYSGDGGAATSAELHWPAGVTVDASGNLYIADYYNNRIRKVTASTGIITTVAGDGTAGYSGDGGPATSAELFLPWSTALDSYGNLYISDQANYRIRKVTASSGIITTVAGTGIDGYNGDNILATSAEINGPAGIAIDAAGTLYISDTNNYRIRTVGQ